MCEYPIRRGPLRFHYWNRRSIKKLSMSLDASSADEMEPYVCPSCATMLYASCEQCEHLRPALMAACPHCGNERSPWEILAAVGERGSTDEAVRQFA